MKHATHLAVASFLSTRALAIEGSPIAKVVAMLDELHAKVVGEGETGQKEYDEFKEWCEERSANVGYEIKTGKAEVEDLKATIASLEAKATGLAAKIEEYAASTAAEEADLKDARAVRAAEAADFKSSAAEMAESIDMLTRAI